MDLSITGKRNNQRNINNHYYARTPDRVSPRGYVYLDYNVGGQGGIACDVFPVTPGGYTIERLRTKDTSRKSRHTRVKLYVIDKRKGAAKLPKKRAIKKVGGPMSDHYVFCMVRYTKERDKPLDAIQVGWFPRKALEKL